MKPEQKRGWRITASSDLAGHIIPEDDIFEHEESERCVCGPDAELFPTVAGDGWIYLHHPLDPAGHWKP